MKKRCIGALLSAMMMLCVPAQAQFSLGGLMEKANKVAEQMDKGEDKGDVLGMVFDMANVATAQNIVGTWVYERPAMVFESKNVMEKLGGLVSGKLIEEKLQKKLGKLGWKKGTMEITFEKDGRFVQRIMGKDIRGSYTMEGSRVKLVYGDVLPQVLGSTQLKGQSLVMAMPTDKLLHYATLLAKYVGGERGQLVSSLLQSYDGMECGFRLKKKTL